MQRVLIVIRAADKDRANALAVQLDPAAQGTFRVPLNASGLAKDDPTHYWAGLVVSDTIFQLLGAILQPNFAGSVFLEWDLDRQPELPGKVLVAMGLQLIGGDP